MFQLTSYFQTTKETVSVSKDKSNFALKIEKWGRGQIRTFQQNAGIRHDFKRIQAANHFLIVNNNFYPQAFLCLFSSLLFVGKYPPAILQYSCLIGNQLPLGNKILCSSVTIFSTPILSLRKTLTREIIFLK